MKLFEGNLRGILLFWKEPHRIIVHVSLHLHLENSTRDKYVSSAVEKWRCFFMKIEKIEMSSRSIRILWMYGGTHHESFLYRHSDYSWHLDPDTNKLLPVNKEALLTAVQEYLAELSSRPKPEPKQKPKKKKKPSVWFAPGADPRKVLEK